MIRLGHVWVFNDICFGQSKFRLQLQQRLKCLGLVQIGSIPINHLNT